MYTDFEDYFVKVPKAMRSKASKLMSSSALVYSQGEEELDEEVDNLHSTGD